MSSRLLLLLITVLTRTGLALPPESARPCDLELMAKRMGIPVEELRRLTGGAAIKFEPPPLEDAGLPRPRPIYSPERLKELRLHLDHAARLARAGDLDAAIVTLSDVTPIERNGIVVKFARDLLDPADYDGATEHAYYQAIRHDLAEGHVNVGAGEVTLHLPPCKTGTLRQRAWAERAWIRATIEETGHVAQLLSWDKGPVSGRLSVMFAHGMARRSAVAAEVERRAAFAPRPRVYIVEADIYAYLIEALGPEFVPTWFATESGYPSRRFVDEELTRRGVPGRAWTTPLVDPEDKF